MDENQKVSAEIAKVKPDGSIEVFLHEPEHVAMVARSALAMKNENEQLRALLDQSLKDTERLDWLEASEFWPASLDFWPHHLPQAGGNLRAAIDAAMEEVKP